MFFSSSEKLNLKDNSEWIFDILYNSLFFKSSSIGFINSLNFGMYSNGKQIGYARVVTDFAIFAYILDVFITEKERGKGLSIKIQALFGIALEDSFFFSLHFLWVWNLLPKIQISYSKISIILTGGL